MRLLTPMQSNPKTRKGLDAARLEGVILHLLAADAGPKALGLAGTTLCPMAERNRCEAACLVHQGRGRMSRTYRARLARTRLFLTDKDAFYASVRRELRSLERRAARKRFAPIARLDGTSDLGLGLKFAREFPGVLFYDYTKVPARVRKWIREGPDNVHLTFSRGAGNDGVARAMLRHGCNVAVVFRRRRSERLPKEWAGFPVFDGDKSDFRFMDPVGVVVGLRAKGSAYYDRSGFVVEGGR